MTKNISNSELLSCFRAALIQAALGRPDVEEMSLEAEILRRMKPKVRRTSAKEPLPVETYANVVKTFKEITR